MTESNQSPDPVAELTTLATSLSAELDDELADRQYALEQALARIQDIAQAMTARRTAAAALLAGYQRDVQTADVAARAMSGAQLADTLGALLAGVQPAGELEFALHVADPMDVRLDNLRRAFVDAIAYRNLRAAGPCTECAALGRPCEPHEGDLSWASLYAGLAVGLGAGPVTTYPIRVTRWEGGWELHIDQLGVTQLVTLDEAPAMVRDFVALEIGVPADSVAVDIRWITSDDHPRAEGWAVAAEAVATDEDVADVAAAEAAMAEPGESIPWGDVQAEFGGPGSPAEGDDR